MKTVQIVEAGTEEVIASFTEYPEGIRGIMAEGYRAIVDGQELKIETERESTLENVGGEQHEVD